MRLDAFHDHVLAQRTHAGPAAPLSAAQIGRVLGQTRRRELQLARGFRECRGLTHEQLEDIYQDTVIALLQREQRNEEHLIGALRLGIKQRALKHHRDARRRLEILQEHAPGIEREAVARAAEAGPEHSAMLDADKAIVGDLDDLERRLFCACALEGIGYRAAARLLGLDILGARRAMRAGERKRASYADGRRT